MTRQISAQNSECSAVTCKEMMTTSEEMEQAKWVHIGADPLFLVSKCENSIESKMEC